LTTAKLTDHEAAIAEYADNMLRRGGTLGEIVIYLRSNGLPKLTERQLEDWLKRPNREPSHTEDPFGGERDEIRRADKMEAKMRQAAETIPGAAEVLGLNAFGQVIAENGTEAAQEVLRGFVHFMLDELETAHESLTITSIPIPKGGRYELWDYHGARTTRASATAIFDASGDIVRIEHMTRPKRPARMKGRGMILDVRKWTMEFKCDTHAMLQRLIQVILTFLPNRHAPLTQAELAHLMGRTKQAISHQRLLIVDRVRERTGARAGFHGIRNLRRKGKPGGRGNQQPSTIKVSA
jgi:hypothetical protein